MAKPPKGKSASAYKRVGTTYDGVSVLEQKTKSKKYTPAEIRAVLAQVMSETLPEPTRPTRKGNIIVQQTSDGQFGMKRPGTKRLSGKRPTQKEAIERAQELEPGKSPLVRRVKNTAKGKAGAFRKV